MKPKVFFVIPSLHKGGAERVISILSNGFAERGFRIFLILLNDSAYSYMLDPSIQVVCLNNGIRKNILLNRVYYSFQTFRKLMALVIKEQPKLMISFITSANLWTGMMGSLFRIPYIVSERNNPEKKIAILNVLMQRIIYFLYKRAKVIVMPSQGMVQSLQAIGLFKSLNNFKVIFNPVSDFEKFSVQPVHIKKFVLSVGRLHAAKGYDRLIKAYKEAGIDEAIDLLIVGEGSERKNIEKLINSLGLNNRVFLVGSKNNIQDYYKQCDLYVLSSHYEGYPNVLIEAMSLGCPVVSFDCDFGPREIIEHRTNGILIPQNNTQLLAEAMNTILSNPTLRKRLADKAMEVGVTNSANMILSHWERLVSDILRINVDYLKNYKKSFDRKGKASFKMGESYK